MPQEILAENGTKFLIAAVVVLLGLLCLALVLWIVRGRPSSPFIRGGRNRTPRLAVLDAAAIDTRRRLVLVRRDDVEHLIMIGGPTDVVIESRIATARAEGETVPAVRETPAKAAETPIARTPAVTATAGAAERRPAAQPEGVSAMGKVLYAGEDDARPVQAARPLTQPSTAQQAQTIPQRRTEDMQEQNRQRMPAPQGGETALAGQAAQRPATATATAARPVENVAGNTALVTEFEKILEAEMTGNAVLAAPVRTGAQPSAVAADQARQPSAKSREEAEAEMARLLDEIAANRKS